VAEQVAVGNVVGGSGRMEWGPRALATVPFSPHPGLPNMKDVLNARIKHRECFRPSLLLSLPITSTNTSSTIIHLLHAPRLQNPPEKT